jgi:hypothetical protein
MTTPLCQRLTELDTGPIVGVIRTIAHGEQPTHEAIREASGATFELASVNFLAGGVMRAIATGRLGQTEAIALLQDEPTRS